MAGLLALLNARFPDATIKECDDLGLPCCIVTIAGVDLKVTELHAGAAITNAPNEFTGMTQRGPWDIR